MGYRADGLRSWKENAQGVRTYFLFIIAMKSQAARFMRAAFCSFPHTVFVRLFDRSSSPLLPPSHSPWKPYRALALVALFHLLGTTWGKNLCWNGAGFDFLMERHNFKGLCCRVLHRL
jgi:hypothetical protein